MCSKSLGIREMQIKVIILYHYTPTRKAKTKKTKPSVDNYLEQLGEIVHGCVNWCNCVRNFGLSVKVEHIYPYDPEISHLGIYPRECICVCVCVFTRSHTKGYSMNHTRSTLKNTQMGPSTVEWINKLWYTHKKKTLLFFYSHQHFWYHICGIFHTKKYPNS